MSTFLVQQVHIASGTCPGQEGAGVIRLQARDCIVNFYVPHADLEAAKPGRSAELDVGAYDFLRRRRQCMSDIGFAAAVEVAGSKQKLPGRKFNTGQDNAE